MNHAQKQGSIHIDGLIVSGPLVHEPIGKVFSRVSKEDKCEIISVGNNKRREFGSIFLQSKDVFAIGDDYWANRLKMDVCPPKYLQGHNVIGHSDPKDYSYQIFEREMMELGIRPKIQDRLAWKNGDVDLHEIHLVASFKCSETDKNSLFDALDASIRSNKQRPMERWFSVGSTENGRSAYHTLTVYDKASELSNSKTQLREGKNEINDFCNETIRVEIKIRAKYLKDIGLNRLSSWDETTAKWLFFKVLNLYELQGSFNRSLPKKIMEDLPAAERRILSLFQNKFLADIDALYAKSSKYKLRKSILEKTDIDIFSNAYLNPENYINIGDVLSESGLVDVPGSIRNLSSYAKTLAEWEADAPECLHKCL